LSLLVVEDLRKVYESGSSGITALSGVSFSVAAGEFVAIRGPSGGGKSTLLHLLGAMDQPSGGSIRLDGQEIGSLGDEELARLRRRRIGFVFQFFNLLPTLTVAENVGLPLLLDGVSESRIASRVKFLLEQVGLSDRRGHYAAQLSGGEMQRAAVARALANEPLLVLADEPTGSLDSANGKQVMRLLADLNERLGVTVLLATHSDEAARYARREIRVRDGRLERTGVDAPFAATL
jgi:ABC-type lipoprotein export system ATPase subunit